MVAVPPAPPPPRQGSSVRAPSLPAPVFMRDRVTDRVRRLSRRGPWYRRPVELGHVALLVLLGLAAVNLLALAPL